MVPGWKLFTNGLAFVQFAVLATVVVLRLLGITPDGSRGPKYEAKSGALLVARASRCPVALVSFSYSRAIRLKSWDEFVIPLPFSRVRLRTRILPNEELFKDRDLDQATKRVQECLMEMTDD